MSPLPLRFAFVVLLLLCSLSAQTSLVDQDWYINYEDKASAATDRPELPNWKVLNLGISWERQNRQNGGVVWLRKDFALGERFDGKALKLEARIRAEKVEVFVNGSRLGEFSESGKLAIFGVPVSALRFGQNNSLALRVTGHSWTGGSCDDSIRLLPGEEDAPAPVISAKALFRQDDHVFAAAEDVRFDTEIAAKGLAGQCTASLLVVSDFHSEICEKEQSFACDDRSTRLAWSVGRLQPGFYQAQLRLRAGDYRAQKIFWFAVDPTKLSAPANPPSDLDSYWLRAKSELAAVRPNFQLTKDDRRSDARHTVYTVEMDSVEGVTLRAWYIVPTKSGPLPAILDVPGYSAAMKPEWFQDDDDLIHLALDIRGHGRSADVLNPGFGTPGFVGFRVNEPERYVYKGAYLDCGRALEFLASRPEVDAKRIAVMGGSQGGGLALASAALFPKLVAACSAGMPFLGDFADHMRIRDVYRAEMQSYVDRYRGCTWLDVYRSMSLVDTHNLAPRIRCPVLMSTGLFDDDCPSHIGFAVYNVIGSEKRYIVYPEGAHLLGSRWTADSKAWIRQVFGLTRP